MDLEAEVSSFGYKCLAIGWIKALSTTGLDRNVTVQAVSAVASPFRPRPLKERLSEMVQRDVPNKSASGVC